MHLLIFGYGYTAQALRRRLGREVALAATSRSATTRAAMRAEGVDALDPADSEALACELEAGASLLVCAPPGEEGCPALLALRGRWPTKPLPWVGYLSTTGVYGDRDGGWVDERTPPAPISPEGRRRLRAEWDWAAQAQGSPLFVFRLPGIYGPGRSPFERLRGGGAQRWNRPGHVFSRIHVDDIASGLEAALLRPERAGVYNLCDDEPAEPSAVTTFAARLLGVAPPPLEAFDASRLSPMAQRFWAESKRVANARAKAALGWRPAYPGYREGLAAVAATLN